MEGKDNSPVVVKIPAANTPHSPLPTSPQQSKNEAFKQGLVNAIALPDNLPDLLFVVTASIAIPALVASCWTTLPLPEFIRFGVVGIVLLALGSWQLVAIAEIREVLVFRLALVVVGVIVGCGV